MRPMANNFSDSFEKFSSAARSILVTAQRYAETMGTGLGSGHVLLALTVTPDSIAHSVLKKLPVTLDQLRLVLRIERPIHAPKGSMTQEAKAVLERAAFQAATHHSPQIEPEHLLWALATDTKCHAYRLIEQMGIDPKMIRKSIERLVSETTERPLGHEIEILGVFNEPLLEHDPAQTPHHVHEDEAEETGEETSLLAQFTVDLTLLASEGKLEPLVGRQAELDRLTHILGRKTKNNPVLIGEPGVGKTAIIEGLAQAITRNAVPAYLAGSRVMSLEPSNLVAGTMYRGQFEDRLRRIIEELNQQEKVILFIDEVHALIGAGSADGTLDAANILKPALAKGHLRLIGATTTAEYHKHIEKDPAFERRLQPILVREPSPTETYTILSGIRPRYEEFHGVRIPDEMITEAVNLAGTFLHDRYFPDKAIDLLDEAAALARAKTTPPRTNPRSTQALERELKILVKQKEYELRQGHIERAAYLRDQESKLRLKLKKQSERTTSTQKRLILTIDHLRKVISRWTDVPLEKLHVVDRQALLKLEDRLAEQIVGQTSALERLARTIRRSKSGLKHPQRPIGVFLFVGPTGVGKTATARVLAEEVFGSPDALVKLDMSEYMERHQVARLLGAPPGYVGYDDSNRLADTVRRRPHRVILFDEIEKAHPDVFHLLLQVMEDGRLTDSKGRHIPFEHSLIILTSNIGGELWQNAAMLGFQRGPSTGKVHDKVKNLLKQRFQPEFLGRLDDVLMFEPLDNASFKSIAELEVKKFTDQVVREGYAITIDQAVMTQLEAKLADPAVGARGIRGLIHSELGSLIAESILRYPSRRELTVTLARDNSFLLRYAKATKRLAERSSATR